MTARSATHLFATMLLAVLVSSPALAAPITGEIGFTGQYATSGGTDQSDDTTISFSSVEVETASGSFTAIDGASATFYTLDFGTPTLPLQPLWDSTLNLVTFSFDLESVTVVFQDINFLLLSGAGTLHGTNFEDTPGTWNLSANTLGAEFTFSSNTAAVPEPSGVLLFSAGLLVVGSALRRRAR